MTPHCYLELGAWSFSGAWCLVLGIWSLYELTLYLQSKS